MDLSLLLSIVTTSVTTSIEHTPTKVQVLFKQIFVFQQKDVAPNIPNLKKLIHPECL